MKGNYLVIIGGGHIQKALVEKALSMNLRVVVVDINENSPSFSLPVNKIVCNISQSKLCLSKVISFFNSKKESPIGCLTLGTDFPVAVAMINEYYGLNGVSLQSAINASNKLLMRRVFHRFGISQPNFMEISNDKIPKHIPLKYPLVLKPTDNMGSRGVIIVHDSHDLKEAISVSLSYSKNKKLILEEMIVGPEFSLDALIINGQISITGLADRLIDFNPYCVEIGHHIPSLHPPEITSKVISEFKKAITALGIVNGYAKGDIFYSTSSNKAMVGEVASRLSGGFMSTHTYPLSSGVDLLKNAINLAIGKIKDIDIEEKSHIYAIERAIIAPKSGVIQSLDFLEEASKVPHINKIIILKKVGDLVQPPTNNVEKIGTIIASHHDYEKGRHQINQSMELLKINIS